MTSSNYFLVSPEVRSGKPPQTNTEALVIGWGLDHAAHYLPKDADFPALLVWVSDKFVNDTGIAIAATEINMAKLGGNGMYEFFVGSIDKEKLFGFDKTSDNVLGTLAIKYAAESCIYPVRELQNTLTLVESLWGYPDDTVFPRGSSKTTEPRFPLGSPSTERHASIDATAIAVE